MGANMSLENLPTNLEHGVEMFADWKYATL